MNTKALLDKIETLPPERQTEVEEFVDFVQQREELRALRHDHDIATVSETAFVRKSSLPIGGVPVF